MTPAILSLMDPAQPTPVFLSKTWEATEDDAQAFVFPSEVLARRYAAMHLVKTNQVLMPVLAPLKTAQVTGHACRQCGCTETFACPSGCSWVEPDLCSLCAAPNDLVIWVVFAPGVDYPEHFIARRYINSIPTNDVVKHESLEGLREAHRKEKFVLPRSPEDPPRVVESWV